MAISLTQRARLDNRIIWVHNQYIWLFDQETKKERAMQHWVVFTAGVLLVIAALAGAKRRRHRADPTSKSGISVDAEGIRRDIGSIHERVRWADLQGIVIMTTNEGPFAEDVFWLFSASDGSGCAVPGEAVDEKLFEQLSRLVGVDYKAIIDAMGSVTNASFKVWERPKAI
jgi:hypothetical protein